MKYLSLFSGIGGFELGIQQAYETTNLRPSEQELDRQNGNLEGRGGEPTRVECIGYSEIDKYACQVYDKQFKHKNYGDITKIIPRELPDFDLLVGGFPCQAFSIAGKRKGFDDTRGTLFFDIARILSEKRPKYLVLENVKGLLSHDKGQTFQTILGVLSDLGYAVEWQVLNSKNFGVPQNRERVFIIGYFGRFPRRKVFPFRESNVKNELEINILGHKDCYRRANQVFDPSGITETMSTCGGGGQHPCTIENPLKDKTKNGWHFEQNVYDDKGITRAVKASSGSGNKLKVLEDSKIRRLTPKECERLQGFPDDWTKDLSDTQRYKTLGNAVTVNVIREIFKRITT